MRGLLIIEIIFSSIQYSFSAVLNAERVTFVCLGYGGQFYLSMSAWFYGDSMWAWYRRMRPKWTIVSKRWNMYWSYQQLQMSLSGRFLGEALWGKCVFNASGPQPKNLHKPRKQTFLHWFLRLIFYILFLGANGFLFTLALSKWWSLFQCGCWLRVSMPGRIWW